MKTKREESALETLLLQVEEDAVYFRAEWKAASVTRERYLYCGWTAACESMAGRIRRLMAQERRAR